MERDLSNDPIFLIDEIKKEKLNGVLGLLKIWPELEHEIRIVGIEELLKYFCSHSYLIEYITLKNEKTGDANVDTLLNYDYLINSLSQVDESAIPKLIEIILDKNCRNEIRSLVSDILLKLGESAKLHLINEWEKGNNKNIFYALEGFKWEPQTLNDKLCFYETTGKWEELIKIGEPAVKILVHHHKWSELSKIGQLVVPSLLNIMSVYKQEQYEYYQITKTLCEIGEPAIPTLVEALKDSNCDVRIAARNVLRHINYVPKTNEEKLTFYLMCRDWKELTNLGTIAIPSLIIELTNYNSSEAGKALVQIGESSVPFLCELLNQHNCCRNKSDSSVLTFVASLLLKIGGKAALLAVLEVLPYMDENSYYHDVCKLLKNAISNVSNIEVEDSINKTTAIFFERLAKGHIVGEVLNSLGADEGKIVNEYINILIRLERPVGYSNILEYFATNKCRQAVKPLLLIINIPKPGREIFYKDIVLTIGKIGDKSALPSLHELLNAHWKVYGRPEASQIVDSKWIEAELNQAIQELE